MIKTISILVLCFSAVAVSAFADKRPSGDNYVPYSGLRAIGVTESDDPFELLQCLLGPDVAISNVTMSAAPGAAGTFTGATDVIGFGDGMILSTGNIVSIVGPNMLDDTTFMNGFPGDTDLDALIPGFTTADATILEFDFECEGADVASFQYVFASEEYNEYVDSEFNDVFAFFLNGVNIAAVPTVCSSPGIPVSINNVNCANPFDPPSGLNCDCFRNNDLDDGGGAIDTEMDGLTQVFFAEGPLVAGTNHIKIAIADAGDMALDSNVLIRCGSFTCGVAPPTGACCFPSGTCVTLTYDDCLDQSGNYYGDDIPCEPNPCEQPVAACCFENGDCQIIGEEGCLANDGIWHTEWDSCEPNPCYQPPVTAVCCRVDGSCVLTVEADCDGDWMPDEYSCEPNPCASSPADDPSWGKIKSLYR
jgi:hypothetical protein